MDDKGPCRRRARAARGRMHHRAVRASGAAREAREASFMVVWLSCTRINSHGCVLVWYNEPRHLVGHHGGEVWRGITVLLWESDVARAICLSQGDTVWIAGCRPVRSFICRLHQARKDAVRSSCPRSRVALAASLPTPRTSLAALASAQLSRPRCTAEA